MSAKIVTLTLSPTIDKSSSVEKLIAEQKLKCAVPKIEPGGGGINVSRGLKRLGKDSLAIFPCGGYDGELFKELLTKENIVHQSIETKSTTRENFIVVDKSTNSQYRFGMPTEEIFPDEEEQILKALESLLPIPEYIIASGSMPPGIGLDFFARVAQFSKKAGLRFIVDTSGEALEQAINEGVFLLKPNLNELSQLVGAKSLDTKEIVNAARKLISDGKCEIVVVSMGAEGAYLVTNELSDHVKAPHVKKLSTVGAGDSMVAGMVFALSNGKSLPEVVRMGVACGSAATMNPGTELFKKVDAEELFRKLNL